MAKLETYNDDGANKQAQAVLAMVQYFWNEDLGWDGATQTSLAEPEVGRWKNGREQGYVISMRSKYRARQLNIAFFEHRNSDEIHAVLWEQASLLTLTIDTAKFTNGYASDNYATSHHVEFLAINAMAQWICKQFEDFWAATEDK